jgi:hypothetical protein
MHIKESAKCVEEIEPVKSFIEVEGIDTFIKFEEKNHVSRA